MHMGSGRRRRQRVRGVPPNPSPAVGQRACAAVRHTLCCAVDRGPHHMQLESSVGTLRVFGENHRQGTHQPPPPSRQRPTLFCALVAAPAETLHLVFNAFFDLRSLLSGQTALDCARELGRRLCHLLAYERILEPRAYVGERGDALTKVLARTAF